MNDNELVKRTVISLVISLTLLISFNYVDNNQDNIIHHEPVDYDRIEEMIKTSVGKSINDELISSGQTVDYDRIETILDERLEEFDKDFGERFEEGTSYFGGKIKETYDDISNHFKND